MAPGGSERLWLLVARRLIATLGQICLTRSHSLRAINFTPCPLIEPRVKELLRIVMRDKIECLDSKLT